MRLIPIVRTPTATGPFICNGTPEMAFPFSRPFTQPSDLTLFLTDTLGNTSVVSPSLYTVTGTVDPLTGLYLNGAWVFVTLNTTPVQGSIISVTRRTPRIQPNHYIPFTAFPLGIYLAQLIRALLIKQETGEHWMGYVDAPPQNGFYEQDDYIHVRGVTAGKPLNAVTLLLGDPGTWQLYDVV